MSNSAIVRKLSTKTVVGNLKAIIAAGLKNDTMINGDTLDVLTLVGVIKKYNEGEHAEFGTYYEFVGMFEGEALCGANAGKTFRAPKCFLPEAATELLIAEMKKVAEENDGVMSDVQVAVKVQVQLDDTTATGYVYQIIPLIAVTNADPLEQIKAKIQAKIEAPQADK